ncbi:MAG: GLPGLI family protein [Prevotellaceae bacterium]|nr:GLPGLI family protein [Prevotellaceae bacterium]
MKRKILLTALLSLIAIMHTNAQTIEVVYEVHPKPAANKMKVAGVDESIINDIAKSVRNLKLKSCLCYSNGESLFRNIKNDSKDNEIEVMGMKVDMNKQMGDDITYRNHKTKKEIRQVNFMGKDFLIDGEMQADEWAVTDSTKKILNYVCTKAISKTDSSIVWFCKNLQISDGPVYTGLSGLVLEVIRQEAVIIAIKISDELSYKIIPPTKGTKISKEEYKATVEKRMKALQF